MAVDIGRLIPIIIKEKHPGTIPRIFSDYAVLKQKLEHPDQQSWYFQRGIESNKRRFASLANEFEEIRQFFNSSSIDYLIGRLNEDKEKIAYLKTRPKGLVLYIYYNSLASDIIFLNEVIELKSKIAKLMPIDYYTEHPEELTKLTD